MVEISIRQLIYIIRAAHFRSFLPHGQDVAIVIIAEMIHTEIHSRGCVESTAAVLGETRTRQAINIIIRIIVFSDLRVSPAFPDCSRYIAIILRGYEIAAG